ncbi:RIP metalloprotease RseP [Methylopila sp. M107]|uniref:RIP metalloprotease RseP n=1 Tax=Methylopila sp. M107 TaxID=1101190 RepID=UPI00035DF73C|nr:RIP metalloprotease RseP [Methylopila sp. M107]
MSFLNEMWGAGWSAGAYVVPFLFVLTIVVFFHELGHFLVARWTGVKVETFSIGFGPEIFGFNDRHDTRWRLAAIPLGGYVKFSGDENAASAPDAETLDHMTPEERRSSFYFAPLPARAAIVAAGPIANFLLAIVIFAGLFTLVGRTVIDARIGSVDPSSAAAEAGLQPGDLVLEIDGHKISSFSDVQRAVEISADRPLRITLERGNEQREITATPKLKEIKDPFGNKLRIGLLGVRPSVEPQNVRLEKYGPIDAVVAGVKETWYILDRTVKFIGGLMTGRESADQLSGPIGIAKMSGDVAKLGFASLISMAALLSVSIGFLNLLPIPVLDGGHLLFFAVEALRGRPLSPRAQEIGMRVGLALILLLMVLATKNDIFNRLSLG